MKTPALAIISVELKNNGQSVKILTRLSKQSFVQYEMTKQRTLLAKFTVPFDEVHESITSWIISQGIRENDILNIGFDY